MKNCIHRHTVNDQTLYGCNNIVDLIHNGTVPKSVCEQCPYAAESEPRGYGDKLANVLKSTGVTSIVEYFVGKECGCTERQDAMNRVTVTDRQIDNGRWAALLTTAPRKQPTLTCCLTSMRRAGWEPTIFAEPDSLEIPNTSYRWSDKRLGVWHNWLRSIRWAYEKTEAEFILSAQDDSLFHPDSRSFVESILWPSPRTGFISLYTPKHYSFNRSNELKPTGVNKLITKSLWGACALVFHRKVIKLILEHEITKTWLGVPRRASSMKERRANAQYRADNPHTIQNSDTAIGKLMNALQLEMFVIDPSPVKHIAVHSAIGHGGNDGRRNCHRCADHSKPLLQQVFPNIGK